MPTMSFEFFPPKTEKGLQNLYQHAKTLSSHNPEFFSVTYGAGGSDQTRTLATVDAIKNHTNINTTPHITCMGSTKAHIQKLLAEYQQNNIDQLVVLRGDLPEGVVSASEDFQYASDLVSFIREHTGDHFKIFVAAYPEFHPETDHAQKGLLNFKRKVECGANVAITQYFYNADGYFYLLDACERLNIHVPIIPGIMPISNYTQLARFSARCGAEIPRWLDKRLQAVEEDLDAVKEIGVEVVTRLCEKLLAGGAPGLHFYTLNKAEASTAVLNNLAIKETVNL